MSVLFRSHGEGRIGFQSSIWSAGVWFAALAFASAVGLQMLVVPVDQSLLVILDLFNSSRRHTMPTVGVADPLDFLAKSSQSVVHLHRLARRHVVILLSGNEKQRRFDPISEHDRRMLYVLLRLLPQSCAYSILALFWGMYIPDTQSRAVGIEADHVDLSRNVDRGFEAMSLSYQQVYGIAAIADTLNSEPVRIGNSHLNQLVRGGGYALYPGLAREPHFQVH